ncbi:MAG: hypothetical protein ACLUEK_12050 [Oscillospiraceae bacterium]
MRSRCWRRITTCSAASGGENCIHILRAEGLKIVHLGDLGCAADERRGIRGCDAIMASEAGC